MSSKYCLPKNLAAKFKEKLKSGEINPESLAKMTTKERRNVFSFLGDVNARNTNALFERKILQKNKWNAMISWIKETTGIKEPIKRDIISKIEKARNEGIDILDPSTEKDFMMDLASSKLGINIEFNEIKKINKITDKMLGAKKSYNENEGKWGSELLRFEYGKNKALLQEYIGELKNKDKKFDWLTATAGTMKSLVASLDNSFFGRQGIKTLYTRPDIWTKDFIKSFGDIGKALIKKDAMLPIKSDIYSRKYAMNGAYERMKLDIGINTEEAFPSSLPEKIPLLGRLYKASEVAFNGAALRMRADLADAALDKAVKNGIDITDKLQVEGLGRIINSMTGRGNIGRLGVYGKEVNVLMFSVKFLKANFDTLTAHLLDKKATPYVKKQAVQNISKIAASVAGILTIAEMMHPGSTEKDPRSSNFGKIKIGNTRFDITGGMSSMVTLASRIIPTMHNGEWGFWTKSSTTGKMTRMSTGAFASRTPVDVINDFFYGKLSPTMGLIRDAWKQEFFGGELFTLRGALKRSITPISIQQWEEIKKDPNSADDILSIILEMLGISASNYSATSFNDWNRSEGKELNQFKEKVGQEKFNEANEKYNNLVDQKLEEIFKSSEYKSLSEENKQKVITKLKNTIKDQIFKEYNFKYKSLKKENEKEQEIINNLIK